VVDCGDRGRDHRRVGGGRPPDAGASRRPAGPADSPALTIMFTVFLVPAGRDRFELYSEPPEEPGVAPATDAGRIRQWTHSASVRWHALVDRARRGEAEGLFGRWRDTLVCRLAESIAEQRTLWALRRQTEAVLEYPSTIDEPRARRVLDRALDGARVHHGRWLIVDLVLFVASGVLFFVPGPNVVAY